jgi:long-chain acyl-CoA synthetase
MSTTLRHVGIHAKNNPNKIAAILAETGDQVTYGNLNSFALKLANYYRSSGLIYGDHVVYLLENSIDCIRLQCGAHYAGLYYTFLNTRLTTQEKLYIIDDCAAKKVIVSDSLYSDELNEALKQLANSPELIVIGDYRSKNVLDLDQVLKDVSDEVSFELLEGSEMLYSAGTTGKPKGVKPDLTGLPLGSTEIIATQIEKAFGANDQTIYLSPAPYYHAAPMKWSRAVLALGGTVVLMKKFDPVEALKAIEKYGVTHSQWVPTMFHRLLDLPVAERQKFDLSHHKYVIHAAAPCPPQTKMKMIEWWGPIIYEYYGSTEQIGMTMTNTQDWLTHKGTVGRAIYGVIHIVNDDGLELGVNEIGNVYFSDSAKFSYHNDNEKTKQAYNDQGWASVGDIGYLDQDGFLYLTDRKSNLIISGGVNIYPQETENVLIDHELVKDVAVFGIPNEEFGESVHAVIELHDSRLASEQLKTELDIFCRKEISAIKCPRSYEFTKELPREPNGKLMKRFLRDAYLVNK